MTDVFFTIEERFYLTWVARERQRINDEAGVHDRVIGLDSVQAHILGAGGEGALAKALGLELEEEVEALEHPDKGVDLEHEGYTYQVKMPSRPGYKFILPAFRDKPKDIKADFGVLVWPLNEPTWRGVCGTDAKIVGWFDSKTWKAYRQWDDTTSAWTLPRARFRKGPLPGSQRRKTFSWLT